ncbi:hypothetical protein SAMN06275492_11464 [Dethiosulfovibrio salsuginis]|uniref:Uncharacterized protein n=1 Tax=Dethiosulfovibrio salsuginis TaxID=561720 RepID=A0A1X7JQX8_9BACT|nr:hypothetical protein SAMN06275492_11464 [Dethiosulfovibrio salsuginis]
MSSHVVDSLTFAFPDEWVFLQEIFVDFTLMMVL